MMPLCQKMYGNTDVNVLLAGHCPWRIYKYTYNHPLTYIWLQNAIQKGVLTIRAYTLLHFKMLCAVNQNKVKAIFEI